MKWIGIVGSRRRNTKADFDIVEKKFLEFYEPGDALVSGGCSTGADRFAEILAKKYQVPIMIWYAAWDRFGKSAGFQRNNNIATNAQVLIACVASDRTGGTEDTIKKFNARRKEFPNSYVEDALQLV